MNAPTDLLASISGLGEKQKMNLYKRKNNYLCFQPGPKVISYKTFLMLNSAELEILTAHKYFNSQN